MTALQTVTELAHMDAMTAFLVRLIDARLGVSIGVSAEDRLEHIARALRTNAGPGARLYVVGAAHEFSAETQGRWAKAGLAKTFDHQSNDVAQGLADLLSRGYGGRIDFICVESDQAPLQAPLADWASLLRRGGLMMGLGACPDAISADGAPHMSSVSIGPDAWMAQRL